MVDVEDIKKQIFSQAAKAGKNPYPTFYDVAMGFFHAVDWENEKWLQGLLATHLILYIAVIALRKNWSFQTVAFFLICGLVFVSERLNSYCAENWKQFSTQDYFDKSGVFAGVVYAGPLILLLVFQLFNFIYMTSHMLVKVKRVELKVDQRQKKEN